MMMFCDDVGILGCGFVMGLVCVWGDLGCVCVCVSV